MSQNKKKRRVSLDCLGPRALLQLAAEGVNVSKQLAAKGLPPVGIAVGLAPSEKRHKYNISPKEQRTVDGITFASKFEMNAYMCLRDRRIAFTRQPRYVLQEGFVDPGTGRKIREIAYNADFLLRDGSGAEFILDTKGMQTAEFKIKAKMMLAKGLTIVCIKSLGQLMSFLAEHHLLPQQ